MRPLCFSSNLPSCCSLYFTLCLLNPTAGVMSLVEFRKKGMVDDNSVLVASLVSGLPVLIYLTLFVTGPVVLPLLGFSAGFLYLVCFLVCGLFQTLIGIAAGKLLLKKVVIREFVDDERMKKLSISTNLKLSFLEAIKSLKSIARILIPITFLDFLLSNSGVMTLIGEIARPLIAFIGLPASSINLIITSTMNIVTAYGIGGLLLSEGILTGMEVVISLMCGAFLYNLGELWHTFLPYNISFFGLKLGTKISFALFLAIAVSEVLLLTVLVALPKNSYVVTK